MMKKNSHNSSDTSSSITEAFIKHKTFLKRYLSRFLSSSQDIDDVVQDTYLKSYAAEKKGVIRSPKAFLFRVARNSALKELTRKSRQITNYIEDKDESGVIYDEPSLDELMMAKQKLGMFCQSALEMTPRCRRVFLMAKVYGFSYKEIASELDITVSAVEKHVARGLEICTAYVREKEGTGMSQADGIQQVDSRENNAGNVVNLFDRAAQGSENR